MKGKVLLVTGVAVGYVLGTRRGREGYEKLKRQANDTWSNPKVQRTVSNAQRFAQEKIPMVGDAISDTVNKLNGKRGQGAGMGGTGTTGMGSAGMGSTGGTGTGMGGTGTTGTTGTGATRTGTTPGSTSSTGDV